MKIGTRLQLVNMFMMEGNYYPDLTVGKIYTVEDVDEKAEDFYVVDDLGGDHYFPFFGVNDDDDFKTEDYFTIVQ